MTHNHTVHFIAHRGLSARYPENTHAAFNAAWAADCDGIELDIQVSRDGKVAVIHDPTTLRTAGVDYVVAETDWQTLQTLNVGIGGKGGADTFYERIPLLNDVVDRMPVGKLVQIEIKHDITNMNAVITELAEIADLRDDVTLQIISFDPEKLQQIRRELPYLACFLVMDADTSPINDRIGFAVTNGLVGLDMDYRLADADYVQQVQAAGLQIAHWTVNDSALLTDLIANGARFIAGDAADELRQAYLASHTISPSTTKLT